MKRLGRVFFLAIATLFIAQPSSAMSKKQSLQVDVLVLDATMNLAKSGAAGGMYAALKHRPGFSLDPTPTPNADTIYVRKVDAAADRAALAYCPTWNALKWVSKEYSPWLTRVVAGGYASYTDGFSVAREAASHLAQSSRPHSWGPDLLWDITTEAAMDAIKRDASEEEVGRAAAQASWEYVLNISNRIDDAVRAKIGVEYLAEEFDAIQVLNSLKETIDSDAFKQGLPEAQDFYKASVSSLERKMKEQDLVD